MATDNTTVNQGYELPHPGNTTKHDVERIIAALTAIDMDVATLVGALLLKAALESPAFSGTPTAPTQPAGTNNNTLATTGHVQLALEAFLSEAAGALDTIAALEAALGEGELADELLTQLGLKAPLASPALTGTPTAPTADTATSTTQIATTAFVQAVNDALIAGAPTGLNTLAKIAASLGGDATFVTTVATALALKAPLASPALTGNPTAPTQTVGNNSTRLATTAFVQAAINLFALTVTSDLENKAPLVSPALTGTPTAPTQSPGNNSTRIATTAFVAAALSLALAGVDDDIDAAVANLVPTARTITAGSGLTGGGSLAANRTISHADTSTQASVNNSAPNFIQDITLDGFGHVTGLVSGSILSALASMTAGAVGSFALLGMPPGTTIAAISVGGTKAGSSLRYVSIIGTEGINSNFEIVRSMGTPSGTWLCLSGFSGSDGSTGAAGLFLRIL